jgi:predicted DNA-binding transcriptional regulator AlpA
MSTEQLQQATTTARRYGRMDALCTYLGISAATGWRRVQDDPAFPRPIKVSDGVTLFDLREADLYVASKRAASVTKDAGAPSMGCGHE